MEAVVIYTIGVGLSLLLGAIYLTYTTRLVKDYWKPTYWSATATTLTMLTAFVLSLAQRFGLLVLHPQVVLFSLEIAIALMAITFLLLAYTHRRERKLPAVIEALVVEHENGTE